MSCGAADSNGRFETFLVLDNGGRPDVTAPEPIRDQFQSDEAEIRRLIQRQARDWNAGDIDRFMDVYWKSDQLTFSSAGNLTRGWRNTLQRYKSRYPNRETMGQVAFTDLECLSLDDNAIQVLGVWELRRTVEPIGGRFTLVFRRLPEGWKIVHDHTSVLEPK